MEENVVQMPSMLDRLADRLRGLLVKEAANRQEWIDIQIDKCLTLAAMRSQFKANILFGEWFDKSDFGMSHQDRAAAIAMGKEPDALRACLEASSRESLRHIHGREFFRFTQVGKTADKKSGKQSPKTDSTREAVREAVESGESVNQTEVASRLGVSRSTVQLAVQREMGRTETQPVIEPLRPDEMSPSMRERYEAALRVARREIRREERAALEAEFRAKEDELRKQFDFYVKQHSERLAVADKLLANYAGIMSMEQFNTILYCLHPDSRMRDATQAFQIFNEKKPFLVKPEVRYSGPPLPQTAAELMAQRRRK